MNKQQLVEAVAARLGSDKKTAEAAVNAVVDTIQAAVAEGEKIALLGFGSFERVERPERDARNPQTGATIKVPATAVPKFKPGADFKTRVAAGRAPLGA